MTQRPVLAVVELSGSFRALWSDLAAECAAQEELLAPEAPPPPGSAVLIVAAGGEEDRALDLLPALRRGDALPVLVVGARASHRFAIEAVRRGATDYFALPDDVDLLRRTVAARIEAAGARTRGGAPAAAADPFGALKGESPLLKLVLADARRLLPHAGVTVLIRGETGSGKELLARALHDGGPRAAAAFVAVNCAAIPSELMESELFGHERGAFTDAHAAKPGLFEEADGGTLFLDEIGHLPLHLQGKLLRALEEQRLRRVGGTQSRTVDVRVIAATHVDLAAAVARGEFREDLYYRVNVVGLTIPPLRERGDDVVLLAGHFAELLAARFGLPAPQLTEPVVAALRRHRWPGNVRELRHAVERALLLSAPGMLDPVHLVAAASDRPAAGGGPIPFPATLDQIQTAAARAAVARHDGNKSAAARELGVSRARLQRLLDRGSEPA